MLEKKLISEEWGLNIQSHSEIDFIDINLNDDSKFFIDPILIKSYNTELGKTMDKKIGSFFNQFYNAYRDNDMLLKKEILSHASEINATKLRHGNGRNGKGNTVDGLIKLFEPLEKLVRDITSISTSIDTVVFIPGFAEDGLSDLLTNILHKELNDFTLNNMKKYKIMPNDEDIYYYWDDKSNNWTYEKKKCYSYNGNKVLLVPKNIVRKRYLFNTGQYFSRIILDIEQGKGLWVDGKTGKVIPKKIIEEEIKDEENKKSYDKHWKYNYSKNYTKQNNDALNIYHDKINSFYINAGIEDEEFDKYFYQE